VLVDAVTYVSYAAVVVVNVVVEIVAVVLVLVLDLRFAKEAKTDFMAMWMLYIINT